MSKSFCSVRYALLCVALVNGLVPAQSFAEAAPSTSTSRLQVLPEPDTAEPTSRPLSIKGWKTTAGSKVLFIRTTASPMFDVNVSLAAGSKWDNDTPGLAAVTLSSLNEGAAGMTDSSAVIAAFHGWGARFTQAIDRERAAFTLRSLSAVDKSTPALHLFAQVLGKPLLSDEAIARVKDELKDKLDFYDYSEEVAARHLISQLAPQDPYAYPVMGTEEGLESVTAQSIRAFHQKAYSARNAQITLVGDLTLEQAQLISQQISEALPDTTPIAPANKPSTSIGTPINKHVEQQLSQTLLQLAQFSDLHHPDDVLALRAARMIFGDGMNSRLMTELREKRGLVYDVDIESFKWNEHDLFTITLLTSPQFIQGTETLVRSMFQDYLRDGPTQKELDRLKHRLANENIRGSLGNTQILNRLVGINRNEEPLDLGYTARQMQQVSVKQIKDALNRHFAADRWHVVTIGPSIAQQPLPSQVSPPVDTSSGYLCRATAPPAAS